VEEAVNKKRKRELVAVANVVLGVRVHTGRLRLLGGLFGDSKRYVTDVVNRQRQLKKAFLRARRRGTPARRAMTDAALEVGRYR
jgi:hypothetical protein